MPRTAFNLKHRGTGMTNKYEIAVIRDVSSWVALLPEQKDHGKRGKKGKSNKDWHK
jgi:hypothetical protein